MSHIYLAAVAFGVTLLAASLLLHGGKDTGHHGGADAGLGWAPVMSLRFWVFFFAFGGAAGLALDALESNEVMVAAAAGGIGWVSGVMAVAIIRGLTKRSVSSELGASELVGATGTLLLPAGPNKAGKVRVEIKGRTEDYVALVVDEGAELPTGSQVLIVAEGEQGALLVAKSEV